MGNEIMRAMAARLQESFGDGYKIYEGDKEQPAETPCFFLELTNFSETPLTGSRYQRQYRVAVTFVAKAEEIYEELYEVGEQLMTELEWLPLETGLVRGRNLACQLDGKTIGFTVSYLFTIIKEADAEAAMDSLQMLNKTSTR